MQAASRTVIELQLIHDAAQHWAHHTRRGVLAAWATWATANRRERAAQVQQSFWLGCVLASTGL